MLQPVTFLLILFCATTSAVVEFSVQKGFEHPDVDHHGFLLDSVFTHHATALATAKVGSKGSKGSRRRLDSITHFVTQRKLTFKNYQNRRDLYDPKSAFDSVMKINNPPNGANILDSTKTLTREKVRALAKFIFLNARGAQDWKDYMFAYKSVAAAAEAGDLWYTDTKGEAAYTEMNKMVMTFLAATEAETNAVADAHNAIIQENDVPNRENGRAAIGLVALLWKKGDERILWWRDTVSAGDAINIESWFTSAFADEKHGMTKWMKDGWLGAGLEFDDEMTKRSKASSTKQKALLQTALYGKKVTGDFAEDLVTAVNGKKIGGKIRNGVAGRTVESTQTITLTKDEATKQGYWPVTKQIIEALRSDMGDTSAALLISGHSQGGGRAQLHRMYLEKKYQETPPVVSFAAVGPACFSRNLDGRGRTDMLDDVDPTKFYDDVTDYQHFFDPWGSSLGPDVGTTCHFGKPNNDVEELKKTRAYKYCQKIQGTKGPILFEALATGVQPLKNDFATCRFFTHTQISIINYLGNDNDLLLDGTTAGGCTKYDPGKTFVWFSLAKPVQHLRVSLFFFFLLPR